MTASNIDKLSSLLLDSDEARTSHQLLTAAQGVASLLGLPLVLDLDDADRVLRAGAHRLAAFRRTQALFA